MSARVTLPGCLSGLLRSELERAIFESSLSEDDTLIATRYFVEKTPQIDIAVELNVSRKNICERVKRITSSLSQTSIKLFSVPR